MLLGPVFVCTQRAVGCSLATGTGPGSRVAQSLLETAPRCPAKGLPPCDASLQDAAMHLSPGVLLALVLGVAVIVALKVRSRRKRTAVLAAQWQAFQPGKQAEEIFL